jgi:hypothetical protein
VARRRREHERVLAEHDARQPGDLGAERDDGAVELALREPLEQRRRLLLDRMGGAGLGATVGSR